MKRTMLLTNSRSLGCLKGKGSAKRKGAKALCRKYLDSKGRPAFAGTKALKKSQMLILCFSMF